MTTFLLALFLASPAAAQCDVYKDLYKDSDQQQPAPVVHASSPWAWQEARALYERSWKAGLKAAGLAGTWQRVGQTQSSSETMGAVNLGGFDVAGVRGRLTITLPPQDNPFTSLPKVVVQGENQTGVLVETDKGWDFQSTSVDGKDWSLYSCRLIDADNMICTVGTVFLAYARQK